MMHKRSRFYEIDLFRFLAALSVVLYHYTFRGYASDNMSILSFYHLGEIFKYGHLGVDLFFMISGFVILLTALHKNTKEFVISRIVRLYPTFWVGVSLTTIATLFLGSERYYVSLSQYLANLTMISGFFGIEHVDGVYWSLLVELKFYVLILILVAVGYIGKIKYIAGLWAVVSFMISFLGAPKFIKFILFPEWAPYFIAGIMFYLISIENLSFYKLSIISISYYLSIKYGYWRELSLERHLNTSFSISITIGIITIFYIVFFMISLKKTTFLNRKEMLWFGALTYPLYLIHQHIGFMIFNTYGGEINKHLLLLITTILMLLASYIITKIVEQRMTKPFKNFLDSSISRIPFSKKV